MFSDEYMHGSLSSIYLGIRFPGHQLDQYSALADTDKYFTSVIIPIDIPTAVHESYSWSLKL